MVTHRIAVVAFIALAACTACTAAEKPELVVPPVAIDVSVESPDDQSFVVLQAYTYGGQINGQESVLSGTLAQAGDCLAVKTDVGVSVLVLYAPMVDADVFPFEVKGEKLKLGTEMAFAGGFRDEPSVLAACEGADSAFIAGERTG